MGIDELYEKEISYGFYIRSDRISSSRGYIFMFNNPGSKIKTIALILFWLSALLCIVFAFVLGFGSGTFRPTEFFCLLLIGPFGAYVSSLLVYGFGRLIENSEPEDEDEFEEDEKEEE